MCFHNLKEWLPVRFYMESSSSHSLFLIFDFSLLFPLSINLFHLCLSQNYQHSPKREGLLNFLRVMLKSTREINSL